MNIKHKVVAIVAVVLFALPGVSLAQTESTATLLAKIAALQTQLQALQSQLNAQGGSTTTGTTNTDISSTGGASCYTFSANLSIGMSGAAITALQTDLQNDGESVQITGRFDDQTAAAITTFQEKYASQILAPYGLTNGTGYAGKSTRAELNSLFGCGATNPTPASITSTPTPTPVSKPAFSCPAWGCTVPATVTPPTTIGGILTGFISANTPQASYLGMSFASVNVAQYQFKADANGSETLTRLNITDSSSATALSTATDHSTFVNYRLTDMSGNVLATAAEGANGTLQFNLSGLQIPANSTELVNLIADVNAYPYAVSGSKHAFALTSFNYFNAGVANTANVTNNNIGNLFTIYQTILNAVGASFTNPTSIATVGNAVGEFTFTAGFGNISPTVKTITLSTNGSVLQASTMQTLGLYDSSNPAVLLASATGSNNFVFNLSAVNPNQWVIPYGSSRTLLVKILSAPTNLASVPSGGGSYQVLLQGITWTDGVTSNITSLSPSISMPIAGQLITGLSGSGSGSNTGTTLSISSFTVTPFSSNPSAYPFSAKYPFGYEVSYVVLYNFVPQPVTVTMSCASGLTIDNINDGGSLQPLQCNVPIQGATAAQDYDMVFINTSGNTINENITLSVGGLSPVTKTISIAPQINLSGPAESINVTYPSAGFSLSNGGKNSIATIQWTASNIPSGFGIALLNGAGTSVIKYLTNAALSPTATSFVWANDPSLPSGTYQIEVYSSEAGGGAQSLSGPFSIVTVQNTPTPTSTTPYITVLSPNGGEIWTFYQTQTVKWTASPNLGSLNVYLDSATNPNQSYLYSYNVPANPSTETLQGLPPTDLNGNTIPPGSYYLRIATQDGKVSDRSAAPFTIQNPAIMPSLTITSPNGGETWVMGKTYNITWRSAGINSVWFDECSIVNNVDTLCHQLSVPTTINSVSGLPINANSANGVGSFAYTPAPSDSFYPGNIEIRVIDSDSSAIYDDSDNYFSVVAPSAPTVSQVQNLTVAATTNSSITLSWSPATGTNTVGDYKLYRSTTSGFTPSNSTLIVDGNILSYTDTGLSPGTYYYVVVAQDVNGNKGPPSAQTPYTLQMLVCHGFGNCTPVWLPSPPVPTVSQIQNLTLTNGGSDLSLSWSPATAANGVGEYEIYRSTSSGFTPSSANFISQTNTTSYMDIVTSPGTYYYVVVAQDVNGNVGSPSAQVSTTVAPMSSTAIPGIQLLINGSNQPAYVAPGASLYLTWNSANITSCSGSNAVGWSANLPNTGSLTLTAPTAPNLYFYQVTCNTPAGSTVANGVEVIISSPGLGLSSSNNSSNQTAIVSQSLQGLLGQLSALLKEL